MFELVREEGDDEGEDERTGPRGDAVQLGADLGVAVCFDDSGGEECVAVGGDDEPKVHESAEEEFEVFEAAEDVSRGDAALAGGATLVLLEPGSDVRALVFFEPANSGVNCRIQPEGGRDREAIYYHFASSGKSGIIK